MWCSQSSMKAEGRSMIALKLSPRDGSPHQVFGSFFDLLPIALSIARSALKTAFSREKDTPVLVVFSFKYTVHRKPVGLPVCTIS